MIGGGGGDSFRGGAGNDVLKIGDAGFLDIDGGTGRDSLVMTGDGGVIDLTAISNLRLSGIEAINLAGSGANTLVLGVLDLLELSDTSNALTVRGGAQDEVTVVGGDWSDQGVSGGFHVYRLGAAVLRVDADVAVEFV
jgi:hypothetical protein